MKKKFNSSQILKSSEDCNKFSKSVSYETLVGGTATIGREYEQNQRLSKGSANKPLTAVGTLTSLLCNSVKVMEKWLQISPEFRFVKIINIIAVLSIIIISESNAATSGNCGTSSGVPPIYGDNCTWEYDSATKTLYVTGSGQIGSNASSGGVSSAYIPFKTDGAVENVVFDGDFTNIGKGTFFDMKNLTGKITIPDTVTSIGSYAFNSSNITSVTIPSSVERIDYSAFEESSLKSVNFAPNSKLKTIGDSVFRALKNIDSITIPDSVKTIGESAFLGSSFSTIDFGENSQLETIGNSAFSTTKNLQAIRIPDSVKKIDDYAFSNSGVKKIDFGENSQLESIDYRAFQKTNNLTSLILPDSVKTIWSEAFFDSGIKSIFLPSSDVRLVGNVFNGANNLEELICTNAMKNQCLSQINQASLSESILKTYESKGGIYALTDSEGNVAYFDSLANLKGGTACENAILCKATYMAAENDVCSEVSECAKLISNCPRGTHLQNVTCVANPEGCAIYADNACNSCNTGYYKKSGGCVSESVGCGAGYLGKERECISSANGCGAGYKDMGGFCNRIRYTPAEAAPLLNDNNNTVTITFRK